jgi:hypothetical protein
MLATVAVVFILALPVIDTDAAGHYGTLRTHTLLPRQFGMTSRVSIDSVKPIEPARRHFRTFS